MFQAEFRHWKRTTQKHESTSMSQMAQHNDWIQQLFEQRKKSHTSPKVIKKIVIVAERSNSGFSKQKFTPEKMVKVHVADVTAQESFSDKFLNKKKHK